MINGYILIIFFFSCRAKGRVFNNDTSKVILITCHETHPVNQLALNNFKNICNQRAQAEQISLRVIYNEVSVKYFIKYQLYSDELNWKIIII